MELADSIKLLEDEASILMSTDALTRRSRQVMDDLDEWQSSLADQYQGTTYHHIPSKLYASLPEKSPERIFPTMITFPSLLTAYQLTTLWSCLLLLHSTLFLTYRHIHTHHPGVRLDTVPTPPRHTTSTCHDLAILIAQSLEYFAQPDTGLVGAQQVGFPTSVAMGYFSFFNSREVQWFKVIFRRLRGLNVGIEGFLESMFKEQGLQLMIP
jgi:hypothetical protein